MLKGGVFHKGKTDLNPWIIRQITQATTPIHSQLGPLIKTYASWLAVFFLIIAVMLLKKSMIKYLPIFIAYSIIMGLHIHLIQLQ
jgi:multidrug transporter EmrE-like cation transporter